MAINQAWYLLSRAFEAHEETERAAAAVRAVLDDRGAICDTGGARHWNKTYRAAVAARDRARRQEREVIFDAYLSFHEARYACVTAGLNTDGYWISLERELKDALPLWPNR